MTIEEKIFDDFVKDDGGIYIPNSSNYDMLLNSILDISRRYIEEVRIMRPNLPEVNIYYINDTTVNASAFISENKYFIGINIGTVITLQDIFEKIASSDKSYENKLFSLDNKDIIGPNLLYYSMIFLVMHEYSHIRFGHCRLINHLYGESLVEIMKDALVNDGIFRQTLEYDADNCAIANLINRILLVNNFNENSFDKIKDEIGKCSFACYIIFKIFDGGKHKKYENYELDQLAKSTHPRPGIRMNYIMANICSVLYNNFSDDEVVQVSEIMVNYIRTFEQIFDKNISLENLEIGIAYTNKGNQHVKIIHNNWENVRSKLEKFTHDELAPFKKLEFESIIID